MSGLLSLPFRAQAPNLYSTGSVEKLCYRSRPRFHLCTLANSERTSHGSDCEVLASRKRLLTGHEVGLEGQLAPVKQALTDNKVVSLPRTWLAVIIAVVSAS